MKLLKLSFFLMLSMLMVLVGSYSVFAGCSIGQGGSLISLDEGEGTLGKIKGTVTIYYEEVKGNPLQCSLGSTNMFIFVRYRSVVGEVKGPFQAASTYFPYAAITDDGSVEVICFDDIETQKNLLMEWAKGLVPVVFPNLVNVPVTLGLTKAKSVVGTDLGSHPVLPQAVPFGMFNVVITID